MIILTKHGYERSKERTNTRGNKAAERAEKAYWCGKEISSFSKEIQKYLNNVLERSTGDELKVLGNDIYIFGNQMLITTFPLNPKMLNKKRKVVFHDQESF